MSDYPFCGEIFPNTWKFYLNLPWHNFPFKALVWSYLELFHRVIEAGKPLQDNQVPPMTNTPHVTSPEH